MITLLNPRIIESSDKTDAHYEGCLSLFDVRCLVERLLAIHATLRHLVVQGMTCEE